MRQRPFRSIGDKESGGCPGSRYIGSCDKRNCDRRNCDKRNCDKRNCDKKIVIKEAEES
jgi:hypothetical protein